MRQNHSNRVEKTSSRPPTCRTCTSCRARKAKCDSVRPHCGPCEAAGRPCTYPTDARRVARPSNADLKSLEAQVASLRELIPSISGSSSQTSPPCPASLDVYRPAAGNRPSGSITENPSVSWPSPGYGDTAGGDTTPRPVGAPVDWQPLPSPASLHTLRGVHPARDSPGHDSDALMAESHTVASEQDRNSGPSTSETNIAGVVERDGRVEVHGMTSILYEPRTRSSSKSRYNGEKKLHHHQIRDELVANAALQRQREAMAIRQKPISNHFDFDGLDPEMALHLLDLHWNRQHLAYLISYRPAIMDSLSNNGPYANRLLLNAIYYSSSLYSDRIVLRESEDDPQTMGNRFFNRFQQLLVNEMTKPSIPTAVGLLLIGASLLSSGRQSAGWILCGIAYRMIIDLGCHLSMPAQQSRLGASGLTPIEFEIRTRLYWGAFVNDKYQSLYLGRAPVLRPEESRVPQELLDTYEEYELWAPYVDPTTSSPALNHYIPKPAYAISTFQLQIKLSEIAHEIIDSFYSLGSVSRPSSRLIAEKEAIEAKLNDFQENIPLHLRFDPRCDDTPPPHQITPHTTYHTLVILLQRPFLNTGHLRHHCSSPSMLAAGEQKCDQAASSIKYLVEAYTSAFTLRRAPYLLSYATYSAVLVTLKQGSQRGESHPSDPQTMESVRFFWSCLFELQRGCNFGLRKPLSILKNLMSSFGATFPELSTHELMPRQQHRSEANMDDRNRLMEIGHDPNSASIAEGAQQNHISAGHRRTLQDHQQPAQQQTLDPGLDYESWRSCPEIYSHDDSFNGFGLLEDPLFGLFSPSLMETWEPS